MIRPIYALLALSILILQLPVYAQQDDARTTVTKIADLLAQQPSETPERFQDAMNQLAGFTASDISALLQQLVAPGTGDNAGIEYATNSYSYYVLQLGKENQRAVFVNGAIDALDKITNKDNKGYVIQLLQNAGDDTAIEALTTYLNDDYLSEKAARALARIGTESAGQALLSALANASGVMEINLVNALGFMGYVPAEQVILTKVGSSNTDLQKAVLFALSQIGGKNSATVLQKAAQQAGYVYDVTDATSAYINYAQQLVTKGESATAAKLASSLFKVTKGAEQVHTRIAALRLLTQIHQGKQVRALVKASKDTHTVYRNAALGLLEPYLDSSVSSQLIRGLAKADEQVQADIIRYLGNHGQTAALPAVRKALQASSPIVQKSAVEALPKLAGDAAVKELISLLPAYDDEARSEVKQVLLTSKNEQLTALVTHALANEKQPAIQVLFIEVLAHRGAGEGVPIVFDIINGDASKEVKSVAYKSLPQITQPDDINKLVDLLPVADGENTAFVQQALVTAVNRSSDKITHTRQVIERFQTSDSNLQLLFFPVLSGVGGNEALAIVGDYVNHDDSNLRGAATLALSNWSDAEALPQLINLSHRKVMDTGHLDAVINGLVRLVGISTIAADQKVLHLRDVFEVAETVAQKRLILRSLEANKTYNALLFAGNYLDDEQLRSTAANTVMNIALEDQQFYGADVTRLLNKVIVLLSGSESSYLREAIQKHLDELPKERGYVSLFNGKDLDGWKGLVANPIARASMDVETLAEEQAKADQLMREGWYVRDGVLHFNGKGDNIATVNQYGDFELLVDWKLAKDGKDGDAGVYLRGTPQVQIWDTSRVEVGAQVGSGGLYNNEKYESKPLKVADNVLGEWNTFRILMIGDRVTVYLNGELVTDNVILENYWDRSQPIFPTEQIELQAHGTHVSYRDIYIRELPRK